MSQASSRPRTRRRTQRRSPGPYLEIRGRTYYYRRRLCAPVTTVCGRSFLSLSLRTDLPREAMRRAVRLLAAQDEAERQIMTELVTKSLTAEAIRTILAEMLRRELRAILAEQAASLRPTNAEIEARVEELQSEINRLRWPASRERIHLWCQPV